MVYHSNWCYCVCLLDQIMFEAASFDPSTTTSGQFNTQLPINGQFLANNESNIGLTLLYSDQSNQYCPAWTIIKCKLPTQSPYVNWVQKSILNSVSPPLSQVVIESYLPNEPIIGTYPVSFNRQFNLGNSLPVGTAANGLTNDGNLAGTTYGESTVSGDASSSWLLKVGGIMQLGSSSRVGVLTIPNVLIIDINGLQVLSGTSKFDNGAIVTDGSGNFSANSVSTNVVNCGTVNVTTVNVGTVNATHYNSTGSVSFDSGNITTNGAGDLTVKTTTVQTNLVVDGTSTLDNGVITTDGVGNLATTKQVSANIFQLTGAGSVGYKMLVGSISRIHSFNVACINGKVTVNHNLNAIPDIVFLTLHAGTIPVNTLFGYNSSTVNATTIDIWANGLFDVTCVVIRF